MGASFREAVQSAAVATWLLVGAASAQTDTANANDEVARGLFQAGTSAYEAGNYKDALQFYEQAYQRSQRPTLLYNIGQVADRLRQDEKALLSFKAYLDQVPNAPNRVEVEHRVRALEEARRARAAEAATPSAGGVDPQQTAVPTPAQTAAKASAAQPRTTPAVAARDEPSAATRNDAVTKRWWFWTGVGAAVVAGTAVALAVALGGGSAGQASAYQGSAVSLRGP